MLNKSILLGLFLCLTGCQQTSDLSAIADKSEIQTEIKNVIPASTDKQSNTQWKIQQGKVYADNQLIEWSEEVQTGCELCEISKQRVMHPGGPLISYQLMQSKRLRASYNEAIFPWIEVTLAQQAIRVPIVMDNASNELRLQLPHGSMPAKVQQLLQFSVEQQDFQLWIEKYQINRPKQGHVIEQAEYQLKYLLLQVN